PLAGFLGAVGSFGFDGLYEDRFDLRRLQSCRTFVFQNRRNFVQTVFAKDLFFHERLTEGHVNATFGLAFDEQGIESTAAVVGDPNFIDFDFTGNAVAVQLDNGRSKTIGRRGTDSRAFKIARIFRRPVAAGCAQGAVLSFRFGYGFGEG